MIFAAWGGHVDVCELLLRFGASLTPTYGGLIQPTGATVGGLTAHEWAKEKGQRPVSALLGDKARVAALHGAALLEHRPPPRLEGDRSPSAPAPTSSPTARRVSPPKQSGWRRRSEEDEEEEGEDSSPIASPGRLQPVGRRPVARSLQVRSRPIEPAARPARR